MRKLALGKFEAFARNGPTRASTGSLDSKLKICNKPGVKQTSNAKCCDQLVVFKQGFHTHFCFVSSEASHAVNYERVAIRHLGFMFDTFKQDSNVISKIKASLL